MVFYILSIYFIGSSVERAKASLHDICPAVLNGGMTTFLALVVLADSNSHAFLTFFKVFFLTVVFGMFHGVVFLPALMSWIGGDNKKDDVSQIANTNTEAISKLNKISLLDKIFVYITGVKSNPNVWYIFEIQSYFFRVQTWYYE